MDPSPSTPTSHYKLDSFDTASDYSNLSRIRRILKKEFLYMTTPKFALLEFVLREQSNTIQHLKKATPLTNVSTCNG